MEKVIVTAILIIAAVTAAGVVLTSVGHSTSSSSQSVAQSYYEDANRTKTEIEIVAVGSLQAGSKIEAWVKNVGVAPIYAIDKSDLFLIQPGTRYDALTYNNNGTTSKTWYGDLREAGLTWNRHDTLHITIALSCADGIAATDYVLLMSTPNGKTADQVFSGYPPGPSVPTNLVATPDPTPQVTLDWDDVLDPDLAGYNVYRSTTAGGPYTKINGALVLTSDYTDTGMANGTNYYVVTAVGTDSLESCVSDEASASILIWYIQNNPTPPPGDTASQAVLPLDPTSPSASTLYNYDTNRDVFEGRFITKGGVGPGEADPIKTQVWRTAALTDDVSLVGTVTITLWAATKNYDDAKAGEVAAYLRDYNGSTYTEIGNGTVFKANWQGGSGTFVQETITIPSLNYTIPAGNMLVVEMIVTGNSDESMWFAYDTSAYPTRVVGP